MSKSTAVSSKESKKLKRSKSKKDSEIEQSEDETDLNGYKSVPSNFLSELIHANQEYQDIWKNKDESMNPMQLPYRDMIEAEKTKEVEDEIRMVVDQTIRGKDILQFLEKRKNENRKILVIICYIFPSNFNCFFIFFFYFLLYSIERNGLHIKIL
jgi:uncharacterized protein YicC (UPF0701 family)